MALLVTCQLLHRSAESVQTDGNYAGAEVKGWHPEYLLLMTHGRQLTAVNDPQCCTWHAAQARAFGTACGCAASVFVPETRLMIIMIILILIIIQS